MKYPIAEIFTAPQGEGRWTGTLMTFVRMAGCSVGKPSKETPMLHTIDGQETGNRAEICTAWDGRKFTCDTDFQTREVLEVDQIIARFGNVDHVCITGGEPLNRDLQPLLDKIIFEKCMMVHIETSGTIYREEIFERLESYIISRLWITVSPKLGVRREAVSHASEVKLLVDENFDLEQASRLVEGTRAEIYLQPINGEKEVNMENVKRCLEIQKQRPGWKISLQLHKILQTR